MKYILIVSALLFGACSSIVKGDTQNMSVTTPNCPGAECRLQNNQGTYFVASTPGTININKSASAMSIDCKKGSAQEIISVESGKEGMAFGNILAGGIIGAAVDMNTGAAYKYPELVEHPLSCP
jgi:hypothetical protein